MPFIRTGAFVATFLLVTPSIDGEWSVYTGPDEKFEILMPDSVHIDHTPVETPLGALEYVSVWSVDEEQDVQIRYALDYCDYPRHTLHSDSTAFAEVFFDETVQSAVEALDGELIYSDPRTHQTYPARLWKIDCPELGIHIKSKAVIVGNRYYCLSVNVPEALSLQHEGDRFFDSFKLLDR